MVGFASFADVIFSKQVFLSSRHFVPSSFHLSSSLLLAVIVTFPSIAALRGTSTLKVWSNMKFPME